MKKKKKGEKKLLLTKQKVKELTKVDDKQLQDVAGGLFLVSDGCQSRSTFA